MTEVHRPIAKGEILLTDTGNSTEPEKHIISLLIPESLKKEEIVTRFEVNGKSKCIIVVVNHKYEKKKIVSTIYEDWLKTIDKFACQAKGKGIGNKHIMMRGFGGKRVGL